MDIRSRWLNLAFFPQDIRFVLKRILFFTLFLFGLAVLLLLEVRCPRVVSAVHEVSGANALELSIKGGVFFFDR